jgi:hypothetical protein
MNHLGIYNINYGQKKGQKSNCQFDYQPLKVGNRPNLLMCRWHVTYHWKNFDEVYNFALDLTSIRDLHRKLWASKVLGVPIWEFRDSQVGSPEQNNIWVQAPWPCTNKIIKGKVVASPKFDLW